MAIPENRVPGHHFHALILRETEEQGVYSRIGLLSLEEKTHLKRHTYRACKTHLQRERERLYEVVE
jgi:hypothetical protein